MLAWPAANHPASSSRTALTQTFARLRVERTITACTVEASKAHALSSLLTAQNRLADKRPHGAARRQCSQSGRVCGRAMWHKAPKADSHISFYAALLCSKRFPHERLCIMWSELQLEYEKCDSHFHLKWQETKKASVLYLIIMNCTV